VGHCPWGPDSKLAPAGEIPLATCASFSPWETAGLRAGVDTGNRCKMSVQIHGFVATAGHMGQERDLERCDAAQISNAGMRKEGNLSRRLES